MRLLIVEDHPSDRKLLRIQLEAEGHDVVEAANGRQALAALDAGAIDGVVSDIFMPGMDGFRLCHEIRRRPTAHATIPLVLYSGTFFSAADRQLARELGANGFARKPASPAVILAALSARWAPPHVTEGGLMERYGESLARKLEERHEQLQHTLAQLHRAHEAILALNHTIESQRSAALVAARREMTVTRTTVNLNALIDDAIMAVRREAQERHIQWERHSLPQVTGDPELLRQVLVTLIRNALTFSCARDPAIIEIGCRNGRVEETVIFVRDNGIGCDAGGGESGGASAPGFGLAEVYWIVRRHGGLVWSETDVGRGSTFYFSLPRLDPS